MTPLSGHRFPIMFFSSNRPRTGLISFSRLFPLTRVFGLAKPVALPCLTVSVSHQRVLAYLGLPRSGHRAWITTSYVSRSLRTETVTNITCLTNPSTSSSVMSMDLVDMSTFHNHCASEGRLVDSPSHGAEPEGKEKRAVSAQLHETLHSSV